MMVDEYIQNMTASDTAAYTNCPAGHLISKVEKDLKYDKAATGRSAHYYAEVLIKIELGIGDRDELIRQRDVFIENSIHYDTRMEREVRKYVQYCVGVATQAKAVDEAAEVLIEEWVDLGSWSPGKKSKVDFAVVGANTLVVVDLKTGGMRVSAKDDTQLTLYALALMGRYYIDKNVNKAVLAVVQPWMDEAVDSVEMSADMLLQRGKDQSEALKSKNLVKDYDADDHCQVCGLGTKCKHAAEYHIRQAGYILNEDPVVDYEKDTARILSIGNAVTKYFEAFKEDLYKEAIEKQLDIKGVKVVAGKDRSIYKDEEAVVEALMKVRPDMIDVLAPRKPLSISKLKSDHPEIYAEAIAYSDLIAVQTFRSHIVPEDDERRAIPYSEALLKTTIR